MCQTAKEETCLECGKTLKPGKAIWLDMNMRTREFREEPWPEEESQGMFPFGQDCVKTILRNKGQLIKGKGVNEGF